MFKGASKWKIFLPKRDLLSLFNPKHTLFKKKKKNSQGKKLKKKKNSSCICSVAAWTLLLLLQVTCTCKNYAGNFIPDPHTLLAALSIQYSLFVRSALPLLLFQVTYLKAWAMNMRVLFLKIISNTHFSDTVFDSLLPVKFAWNSKICKFMLPTMCQNK